jgi:hypothetical protein
MPLFIGGIKDGEWVDVLLPYPRTFKTRKTFSIFDAHKWLEENKELTGPDLETQTYRREEFIEGNITFTVYVPIEMKESIFNQLLQWYRKPKEES